MESTGRFHSVYKVIKYQNLSGKISVTDNNTHCNIYSYTNRQCVMIQGFKVFESIVSELAEQSKLSAISRKKLCLRMTLMRHSSSVSMVRRLKMS